VSRRGRPSGTRAGSIPGDISFSRREVRDLLIAWLALGVAFMFFRERAVLAGVAGGTITLVPLVRSLGLSLATVGVAFLLHELAHKVVAIRFGQQAAFRADYGMLFLAVMGGLAGFLFAAPGAVVHRGRITPRENGLIAVAGPITNVALGLLFAPLLLVGGFVAELGTLGVSINFLLAGFNMIPYGPLDGRTVFDWDVKIYAAVAIPCVMLALTALLWIGLG
jgi:Zn-dependent protease